MAQNPVSIKDEAILLDDLENSGMKQIKPQVPFNEDINNRWNHKSN